MSDSHDAPLIWRAAKVAAVSGISRPSVYVRMRSGLLPRQFSLGGTTVGWPADEIAAVLNARIAGSTDDEIRALVARLEAERLRTMPAAQEAA
jgi:prophage regulatory protein